MTLYFERSNGQRVLISTPKTFDEGYADMMNDLEKRACESFKSYYQRWWYQDGELKCDVGSWSEFYYLSNLTDEDMMILKERSMV